MYQVIHGSDQLKVNDAKKQFLKTYQSDEFNFMEFDGHIDVAALSSAISQAPMFADYYVVLVHVDRKQFLRIADLLKPAEFTALLLICDGFVLNDDLISLVKPDSIVDCKPMSYRDSVKWIKEQTKNYGYTLDFDERKQLALMFKTSKELSDVLFQMSMLNDFDRRSFFNDLFKTKQEFVWNLFIALTEGNHKAFFKLYADQFAQNVELSKSQFNMKIVGGLIYCLNHHADVPEFISVKLKTLNDDGEKLIPFLHSHLVELLVLARKEQSNIPILMRFVSIMTQIKKL